MIKDVENFGIVTSPEEKTARLALCESCEKLTAVMDTKTCDACACPIEYVIVYKFKICPLGKWEV